MDMDPPAKQHDMNATSPDGDRFCVHAVQRGEPILGENWWDGSIVGIFGFVLLELIRAFTTSSSTPWKVAVVQTHIGWAGREPRAQALRSRHSPLQGDAAVAVRPAPQTG